MRSQDVDEAASRIQGFVRRTPVLAADGVSQDGKVCFKLELLQHAYEGRRP